MMEGKTKCRILRGIRQRIADINNIDYTPHSCDNEGECAGTCGMCDAELEWLNTQLQRKIDEGYSVIVAADEIERYEKELSSDILESYEEL